MRVSFLSTDLNYYYFISAQDFKKPPCGQVRKCVDLFPVIFYMFLQALEALTGQRAVLGIS